MGLLDTLKEKIGIEKKEADLTKNEKEFMEMQDELINSMCGFVKTGERFQTNTHKNYISLSSVNQDKLISLFLDENKIILSRNSKTTSSCVRINDGIVHEQLYSSKINNSQLLKINIRYSKLQLTNGSNMKFKPQFVNEQTNGVLSGLEYEFSDENITMVYSTLRNRIEVLEQSFDKDRISILMELYEMMETLESLYQPHIVNFLTDYRNSRQR